ncbi:TraB/GumN family protein [Candidatus Woesearchaeota archaeon]|nr:TraB/GumN family protein [Candidatus Woesearchaeota archaeon]
MKYKTIVLLGTSHISPKSIRAIKDTMEEIHPDIVAVELDHKRLDALLHQQQKNYLSIHAMWKVGFKGFLFALIGSYVQRKLGKLVGVEPGADMLTAVTLARRNKIPVALIDQDIEVTLSRFSAKLTWREKGRFLMDIGRGILFKKRQLERWGLSDLDLQSVPPEQVITKLLAYMKVRYPTLYQVLIKERNVVMARRLVKLANEHEGKIILAVIGAGHEKDVLSLIKMYS